MPLEERYRNLIGGEWAEARSGATRLIVNPATGETMAEVPLNDCTDAQAALAAAEAAFPGWAATPAPKRAALLRKAAGVLYQRQEEIARLLTMEQGKPLAESRGEVAGAAQSLEYYAEEATRNYGLTIPTGSANRRSTVIYQPVGVVAAISPGNYPVGLCAWKVAPALAAGCTLVCKPAAETPLAVTAFAGCLHDAGLPAGVVNMVCGGAEVGTELVTNPISRKVSFTGSTVTGRKIMAAAAGHIKKLTLELGGNCPLIVARDADLDQAAKAAAYRAFRNMGQVCNSVNRVYVEAPVHDAFVERLVAAAQTLRIADGLEVPNADLGPMTTDAGLAKVEQHVADALARGAELAAGGRAPAGAGFERGLFYEPTVLLGATHDMLVMSEETFGPVAPVMAVDSMQEAVRLANASPYGLVAYLFTRDLRTAHTVSEALEFGTVGINNVGGGEVAYPYGGWKESGLGVELGHAGLHEYLLTKHIRVDF
ncbi:MAG TPA: NAD-dependent succinate-semialdehyde dehydrogenase [Symbiobacteriaceae bacterium]|nr:NAD-dependent succinate-semialdehyde dehydrogenase [Symbiobacteriaceae bacterium]